MAYILIVLLLLFTPIILAYFYMTRKFSYWKNRGVVFMPPMPFFGNIFHLMTAQKSATQLINEIYYKDKNQPYIGFFALDKPMLLLRDPEIIKNVLTKDSDNFKDRHAGASPTDKIGYASLVLIKNPAWKYVRTKLSPIYTSGKLKLMFQLMLEVARDLDTYMESLSLKGDGKSIEVKEICSKLTTDLIGMTAFGLKVNSLNNPDAEFRKHGQIILGQSFYRTFEWIARFFAPVLMRPLGLSVFSKEASNFLRNALLSTMAERESSGEKRPDLVDLLIELKNNEAKNPDKVFEFAGDNLIGQAAIFFTAGFHTTSSLISYCLYELSLQPELQTRVRREMMDNLEQNNGKITYDMMMNQLHYTQMVVSETLRKYPVLPFLDRVADNDYKISGHDLIIEKGTAVYIPVSALHKDPKYFENPDKFDPERFSSENPKPMAGTYLPFGDGPHICIGMRLGLLQAKLGLFKMISGYEFSPCTETQIPLKMSSKGLLVLTESGIYLNAKKISI